MPANESHLHGFFALADAKQPVVPSPALADRGNAATTPAHGTLFENHPYLLKPVANIPDTPLEKPLELSDLLLFPQQD